MESCGSVLQQVSLATHYVLDCRDGKGSLAYQKKLGGDCRHMEVPTVSYMHWHDSSLYLQASFQRRSEEGLALCLSNHSMPQLSGRQKCSSHLDLAAGLGS